MAAVVTSSILFSITHMLNALSGQSMADTMLQLIYALLLGAVLALLMLKNGNIIPLILFHFIHNLIQFLSDDLQDTDTLPYDLFLLIVLAVHCVWLIYSARKEKRVSADAGPTGHELIH
ncbi:type II CAAX prenyl endopeptidase Rce1 family protein [Paenibacillus illinoisensis]|uniref:CPBP family glutamic-type intramembrane protease n=1 Tax=Paenibacillus illinoisensis TaxID=59845 RepID=UPI003A4E1C97